MAKQESTKYRVSSKDSENYGGAIVYNNQNQNQTSDENGTKLSKKSFAQWRSEIFANPTNEEISLFVQAYKRGEVTTTEFQSMAQDLLDQNDNKLKGLGLFALRSVPSLASLSELVHAQPSLPATYQAYVEQAYIKYFFPANLTYFKSALGTQDKLLKAKVLALLQTYLGKLAQGDMSWLQEARDQRSGTVTTMSMNNYSSLLPVLATLASDPELASEAQAVATLIQTHNNVAQN